MTFTLGGDYSKWDPLLDWKNHTWKYAFVKVSEGLVEDRMWKQQWSAARGHVYRGGYHFFRPMVSWIDAAQKFCYLLVDDPGELPPVLDLEVEDGVDNKTLRNRALEWLRYVHRMVGKRPIVYTAPNFVFTVKLWEEPEFAEYPLWQATYPWDKIEYPWTEAVRAAQIKDVIDGTYKYVFPKTCRPWLDKGKTPRFAQFTGKALPELVPGYPLGFKEAVDVNFYNGTLQDMMYEFNLPQLQEGDEVSTKPITWKAEIKQGATINLRSQPMLGDQYIKKPLVATSVIPLQGTGQEVLADGYRWVEVVLPEAGWVALTSNILNFTWITGEPQVPPPTGARKAIGSRIFYDDGTSETIGQVPS